MNFGQRLLVRFSLSLTAVFFLISSASAQNATIGVDVGETADRFGALSRNTDAVGMIDGQGAIFNWTKNGGPNIVVGGEIRVPADTSAHATEFAGFAGPEFWLRGRFMVGVHITARKAYLPSSEINGMFFERDRMLLLELPVVAEYKFGSARHAFIEAQGTPEFSPHFSGSAAVQEGLFTPILDKGYAFRGTGGYNFGRWYAKAAYEVRYFKFTNNANNPNNLYNWRTNVVTAGVGFSF
jgi:hypothetical protein